MHNIYYFTDIHGDLELFNIIRDWCYQQGPDCTIIYGGDAADRGENGYRIINELLNDPHVIYLYGNHEDLFIKAADELIGYYSCNDEMYHKFHSAQTEDDVFNIINDAYNYDLQLHVNNGGYTTLRDWLLNGANEDIIEDLRQLPKTLVYKNMDFCHAGDKYSTFHNVYTDEYYGRLANISDIHDIIWDRKNLALGWETNRIAIFGHTPTPYLPAALYGSRDKSVRNAHPAIWQDHTGAKHLRGGYKIDMDTGIYYSEIEYVLNIETMEVFKFEKSSSQPLDFYKIL